MFITLYYQLAFLTPGISPNEAISLKVILLIPNCLIYPLGRPVSLQRLRILLGFEFLGNRLKPI